MSKSFVIPKKNCLKTHIPQNILWERRPKKNLSDIPNKKKPPKTTSRTFEMSFGHLRASPWAARGLVVSPSDETSRALQPTFTPPKCHLKKNQEVIQLEIQGGPMSGQVDEYNDLLKVGKFLGGFPAVAARGKGGGFHGDLVLSWVAKHKQLV